MTDAINPNDPKNCQLTESKNPRKLSAELPRCQDFVKIFAVRTKKKSIIQYVATKTDLPATWHAQIKPNFAIFDSAMKREHGR